MPRSVNATAEMKKLADYASTIAREKFGCGLDFSEESLAQLESLLAQAFLRFNKLAIEGELRDNNVNHTAKVWGSYIGEVIRRNWGGQWRRVGDDYELLVRGRSVWPIDFVRKRITSRSNFSAVEYYDYVMAANNLESAKERSKAAVSRNEFTQVHPKPDFKLVGFGIVAMSAMILVVLLMAAFIGNTGGKERVVDEIDAFVMCKGFVRDNLKAPSTASFPSYSSSFAQNLGGGSFRIHAYVDAENSFGANLRTDFVCVVKYTGNDNWRLESLSID